ncbi:MAG: DedA family protein [Chitinophagaceae bacterium]|nr:DedA family protein [Anaerolineae bacterium]
MSDFANQIIKFIENFVEAIGYPGIFLVMFAENVFPPIPTDPLLPFAGILVAEGKLSFFGVWFSAIAGAIIGSLVLYGVGAYAGESVVRTLVRRYGKYFSVSEDELDRALSLFAKYGGLFVFIGRAIPVLRSAVSLTAGMSRMPIPKFILYSAGMSALVTGFWTYAGFVLGENWRDILDNLERYQPLLLIGLIVIVVIGGYWFYRRRVRRKALQPQALSSDTERTNF